MKENRTQRETENHYGKEKGKKERHIKTARKKDKERRWLRWLRGEAMQSFSK